MVVERCAYLDEAGRQTTTCPLTRLPSRCYRNKGSIFFYFGTKIDLKCLNLNLVRAKGAKSPLQPFVVENLAGVQRPESEIRKKYGYLIIVPSTPNSKQVVMHSPCHKLIWTPAGSKAVKRHEKLLGVTY
jgi:hypothetical protein